MGRVGALAIVVLLGMPALARAERLSLRWEGPASCPTQESVVSEIARLLGGTIPEDGPPIRAEATTLQREDGFELTLRTDVEGASGQRVLSASSCEELAAATALILALMIDPEAVVLENAEPQGSPLTAAAPAIARELGSPIASEPAPAPTPEPPPVAPSPPPEALSARIGVGGFLDIGTLPAPTFGVVIEGGLAIPIIEGGLLAVLLVPQTAGAPTLPEATAELWALSAGAYGCVRPIEELRELGFRAEVQAGALFGASSGISDPRFGAGFWMAAGGGLTLTWKPIPLLDLELFATVLGQIAAPQFVVTVGSAGGETTVILFDPPRVSGRFGASAHLHFW